MTQGGIMKGKCMRVGRRRKVCKLYEIMEAGSWKKKRKEKEEWRRKVVGEQQGTEEMRVGGDKKKKWKDKGKENTGGCKKCRGLMKNGKRMMKEWRVGGGMKG